ncbi:flavodoxin domain-containing protein [Candidatus Formimonas warabiya]|uniref:Flavodoxin n=1 Tax=Formimonas warabiya TaxID=1761012 RepID=A0A3G1KVT7_FORW1|nr:flavodoxin domain-containing protein [Candidatus Formimonas warabiya]ATW26562.1 flavodoxin [Candidatus Formimonas warabiya]
MKNAIVFASSHGTTEKAARLLGENLKGEAVLINLKKTPNPDIQGYDGVIIGSSIHAGAIQSKVKQFLKQNQPVFGTKRIGLFLCCMFEDEKAQKQFETGFPRELRERSSANGLFGGEFIFSKMNLVERIIVKKVSGVTADISKLDVNAIKNFAHQFQAS